MKFLIFSLATALQLLISASVFCQNDSITQRRELCFRPNSDFNFFTFIFKKRAGEQTFWRFAASFSSSELVWNKQNASTSMQVSHQMQVIIGREHRKLLDKKLWFSTGFDAFVETGFVLSNPNTLEAQVLASLGYGRIFGLLFDINSRWALGLEAVPSVRMTQRFTGSGKAGSISLKFSGFGSSGLTIVRKLAS